MAIKCRLSVFKGGWWSQGNASRRMSVAADGHWSPDWADLQWKSQALTCPPASLIALKSPICAKKAYKLLSRGVGILWEGDYHCGKSFLSMISKHVKGIASANKDKSANLKSIFLQNRMDQASYVGIISRLIVRVNPGCSLAHLTRAPNLSDALQAAHGVNKSDYYLPLREVLGAIGSWEWCKKGIFVPLLNDKIFPQYGVFCPTVRNDYIELMSTVAINSNVKLAYDIGVGTGVLSALLLKRGVSRVVATDVSDRALACASLNLSRLRLQDRVLLTKGNVFPNVNDIAWRDKPDLIICNPPWMPCAPSSSLLDEAIYDNESSMLMTYLNGIPHYLGPDENCEAFLIMSDLPERIGLRSQNELVDLVHSANLEIIEKIEATPCENPKRINETDQLSSARKDEVTSLWRLKIRKNAI